MATKRTKSDPPALWLPRFSNRDLDRIRTAIELIDQAAAGLRMNRNSSVELAVSILAQAQKPLMEMGAKVAGVIERWQQRTGNEPVEAHRHEPTE